MKSDDVHPARVFCSEVVGETQVLSSRLARKSKPHLLALIVNDQVISFRLALEVTVDHFRIEQFLLYRTFLQLLVNRAHLLAHDRLVFFERHAALDRKSTRLNS